MSVFKLIYKQIDSHNKQSTFFLDIDPFWLILNNQLVINSINNFNNHSKAKSISHALFFQPNEIKISLEIKDFAFKGDKQFTVVGKCDARWIDNEK